MSKTLRKAERPSPDAMTLLEHLSELRRRLIISVLSFAAGAIICYLFYDQILTLLEQPYLTACHNLYHGLGPAKTTTSCALTNLAPLQAFTTRLNVCAYGGVVLGLPVILWQLWQFVTPGLKANEKRYALPFVISTVVLFFFGGLTAYIIYPHGLTWLQQQSGPGVSDFVSIQSYIDLICLLIVVFGATFEFPAVLVGLELAGAVKSASLKRVRRFAFLGIVIFSAVVTPSSDPFSMLALAVPLTLFYESAIIVGRLLGK